MGHHAAFYELGRLPVHLRSFETPRFVVAPLKPGRVRAVLDEMFGDDELTSDLAEMAHKSCNGARRESYLLDLQCTTGVASVWRIVERTHGRRQVGAIVAKNTLDGIDLQVLCASDFRHVTGLAEEAGRPVASWLEEYIEMEIMRPQ